MPDILKVTTPIINKNQPLVPKLGLDPTNTFNIQDTSRVIQTHNQSELQKQNSGLLETGEGPMLLMNLLKDPAVAVSYLKNIFLLEEIFKLLPANNETMTPEIEQAFQSLLMQSNEIMPEMVRQEHASTAFKGPLFDFMRQLSDIYEGNGETQYAIANFLKSVNNLLCKDDILDAVANSLSYLRENLASNASLSQRLDELIAQFRQEGAGKSFPALKEQVLSLFKDVENSLLFSPKLGKVLSITIYNLSRYNNNMDFFSESVYRLRQQLSVAQRQQFSGLIEKFLDDLRGGRFAAPGRDDAANGAASTSRVMDSLIAMVTKQSGNDSLNSADSAKVDKILHSLLSSPCNFTPLLHFIVPAIHQGVRAFAEIWINPESDEKDMPEGAGRGMHFLLVIDVDAIGRFEAELFVHGQVIDFNLFCPPGYEQKYEAMMKTLPKALAGSPYRLGQTRLEPLERQRSLMDVFKSLPYKRVGVDVKI